MQAKPWKHITEMHESVCYPVRVQARVALALAGRYLPAKSFKNKELSLCRDLPTDRGLWRPPTESGTELWSQAKTPNAGKQEGKEVGGEGGEEDIPALSLPILCFWFLNLFFFVVWGRLCPVLRFSPSGPARLWRCTFASESQRIR